MQQRQHPTEIIVEASPQPGIYVVTATWPDGSRTVKRQGLLEAAHFAIRYGRRPTSPCEIIRAGLDAALASETQRILGLRRTA